MICGTNWENYFAHKDYILTLQLCAGAPDKLREQLQLAPPSAFHYLNRGCTRYFCSKETDAALPANRKSKDHQKLGSLKDPMIDDVKNFQTVDQVPTTLLKINTKSCFVVAGAG